MPKYIGFPPSSACSCNPTNPTNAENLSRDIQGAVRTLGRAVPCPHANI
jgi:hypothetical protein